MLILSQDGTSIVNVNTVHSIHVRVKKESLRFGL